MLAGPARGQSSVANIVTGAIAVPGQTDRYAFRLETDARYYFDALTNNGRLVWSLNGPMGGLVSGRSFAGSDAQSIGDPVLSLPAGDYVLTVGGSGDATGPYGFRFVDLAESSPLTPGVSVASSLVPGSETDFYQFSALAGDRFFFNAVSRAGLPNVWWRLVGPLGNSLFAQSFSNVGSSNAPAVLTVAGTYTLLVEGYIGDTAAGNYSFNVVPLGNTPPTPPAGAPLGLGEIVGGTFVAGTTNLYRLSLAGPARVLFDTQTNSSGLDWTLEGPAGVLVERRALNGSDWVNNFAPLELVAGEYQLRLRGGTSNPYRFRLVDLGTAPVFAAGTPVAGALAPATAMSAHEFEVPAPGLYFLNSVTANGLPNAYWKVIDPYGSIVTAGSLGADRGRVALGAGRHLVVIDGYYAEDGSGSYTFNVVPVSDASNPLALGDVVSGAIGVPGQVQRYTFSLEAAARLYFDARTNNSNIRWSLAGPSGDVVNNRSFTSSDGVTVSDPLVRVGPGNHVLSVFGNGDAVGGYQFRMLDLGAAPVAAIGSPVASPPALPANGTAAFRLNVGAEGQRVYFNVQTMTGMPNATMRLVDPFGNFVFGVGSGGDAGPMTLGPGTHTLLVEGYHSDLGAGSFALTVVSVEDVDQPMALGSVVSGALAMPGQVQRHRFAVGGPTRLYFDARTSQANLRWSLVGPAGLVVNNRAFTASDGVTLGNPLIRVLPGDYTILIFGNGDSVGPYAFRMSDLAAADPITLGEPLSVGLSPANATEARQFAVATAGRYYFDARTFTGLPNAVMRLFDPFGNILFSVSAGSDAGPMNLGAGTHTLLVEGYHGDAGNGSFTVAVLPVADATHSFALGDVTSGAIVSPGQRQSYPFSLATPARLYFDARTNNSGLRWVLDGPTGRVISERSFTSSDASSIGDPLIRLAAGDYTLTVSGNGDVVGGYLFRLFDLATAASITPGQVVAGTLNPAHMTEAYQFQVASPGEYYFDSRSLTGLPNAHWRLVNPFGGLTYSASASTDVGPVALGVGTYTVLIEGYQGDAGSGSYNFNVQPVVSATETLGLGDVTSGVIATAGARRAYTFALGAPATLYLDGLTNVGSIVWSLDGPAGNVVRNRAFTSSDGISIANPLLPLGAGSHTLTVAGAGDATGSYRFRLLDLAAGGALPMGTSVSSNDVPANQTTIFRFPAAAGDRFYFDYESASGLANAHWRLVDPLNNIRFGRGFNADAGTNTLPVAGDYTLLIEGYIADSGLGRFAFNVRPEGNVPPTPLPGTPLVLGDTVSGNLPAAASTASYVFSLSAPARLHFDALVNAAFRWSLRNAAGLVVGEHSFQSSDSADGDSAMNLAAGDYQLVVTGAVGDFQFRLLDAATAAGLNLGQLVNGTLAPGRSTTLYQFNGAAGSRYFFDGQTMSGFSVAPYWRLYGPLGGVVNEGNINGDRDTFSLPQTGSYVLSVEGRYFDAGASGNYAFKLQPVSDTTNDLVLGATVAEALVTVGQRRYYTFSIPEARRLYFDVLTGAAFVWRLDGPAGTVVDWRSFQATDSSDFNNPVLALGPGTYRLAIAGEGFALTGDYQFRLLDLAAAASYAPGSVVSDVLAPARATALYRFEGQAGERYFFDGKAATGFSVVPTTRLYGPLGNILVERSASSDEDTFALPQSGTYTLTVEGRYFDNNVSGRYGFNLQPVVNLTNTLSFGDAVTNVVATVGERHFYDFSIAEPRRAYFDALTYGDFAWRLDGPGGAVIDWRSFQATDSADIGDPVIRLSAGSYRLTVAGGGFAVTGGYQFALLDLADATPFHPGDVVGGTLAPARQSALYQFNGVAGDRYFFDGRPASGFSTVPYSRLYTPLGTVAFEVNANANVDTFALPFTGTYVLTVEGRGFDASASGNYAFNLQPETDTTNALAFGETVVDVVAMAGQRKYYTFTLGAPRRLYFDALTNAPFSWRLDGPPGAVVGWRSFQATDSADVGYPVVSLAAGSYRLAVAAGDLASTGEYRFRVLDLADAAPFSPGNPVAGTLAPGLSTALYQFTGAAGERYFFDGQPASGFSTAPYCRLISPLGDVVFERNVISDEGTFSLPQVGVYTLMVEGRYFDTSASGSYAFNLVPNPPRAVQPLLPTNTAPDLVVTAVSVAPATGVLSGDAPTVSWTVQNAGNAPTAGSFTDRVIVRHTGTGQILVDQSLGYSEADPGNGPIAPGAERQRHLAVPLPHGSNSVGVLSVTVTTDSLNQLAEQNSGGTAEINNSASTSLTTGLAPYPDLQVIGLSVDPAVLGPGTNAVVRWLDTNSGRAVATVDWSDRVRIVNTNLGVTLLDTTLVSSVTALGPLTNGTARSRSVTFALPTNTTAVGNLQFTVTADAFNNVLEHQPGVAGEANNTAAVVRTVFGPEHEALFVNVHGTSYDGDGFNFYQTLVAAGARATYVNLDVNGKTLPYFQTNQFDQVWVFDLSSGTDSYPADWQAIADWYQSRPNAAIVCDGRTISSYWSGRWQGEGMRLTKNYYENMKLNGGGLLLGTDHNDFHAGINSINAAIGLNPFVGNFSLSFIPIDVASPLMTFPNNLGAQLFDDSSPGQTPFGLQPNGRILYSVAWHSGNTNTPGISSTIRGGVGFRVRIASPASGSQYDEEATLTLVAQPTGGVAPLTFEWTSDLDGALGTGSPLALSTLSPGQHRISVVGREAGGGADTDTVLVTIRPVTPTVVLDLEAGSDTGVSSSDNLTAIPAPQVDVIVNKRGRVELDWTGDGAADDTLTNLTAGTYAYALPAQPDGVHGIAARFVPLRGNAVSASLAITIDTRGPRALAIVPAGGTISQPMSQFEVTFDTAINPSSLTAADVALAGPEGVIAVTNVTTLASNRFRLLLETQRRNGGYELVLGPNISDLAGNAMNQDDDGSNGEAAEDVFLADYSLALPDLRVVDLLVPTNAVLGQAVAYRFVVTNAGAAATAGSWSGALSLAADAQGAGAARLATQVITGQLAAGASLVLTGSVTIPAGISGRAYFLATADSERQIGEADELNNSLVAAEGVGLTGPDLVVSGVAAAPGVLPGESAPVVWTTHNQGDAPTPDTWIEQVFLSADNQAGGDQLLGTFTVSGSLAPGASVVRTQVVTLPVVAGGSRWLVVRTDVGNTVAERVETNNVAVSGQALELPAVLRLSLSLGSIREDAGAAAARGTVTRNTDTAQPMTVELSSSDLTEATVPASVVIAAGQSSATFAVAAVTDALVDGPQAVTITARAAGMAEGTASLTVEDVNVPQLGLVLSASIADEGDYVVATVTRDWGLDQTLAVNVTSSSALQVSTPSTLVLAAGMGETNFLIQLPDDNLIESTNTYTVSAAAAGYVTGTAVIQVRDNDLPEVTFSLTTTNVSEGGGAQAALATVHRSPVTTRGVVLELISSDSTAARVPARVTIPAGADSASFAVAAVDDSVVDGPQTVTLRCFITDSTTGARLAEVTPVTLNVLDDDGPTLQLSLAPKLVPEGVDNAAVGTVTRNTPATNALVVALESGDTNEARVPRSVTIPIGSVSATFPIQSVSDGVTDDNRDVMITASADGFTAGHATITVSDVNLPDLVADVVDLPASAPTESFVTVRYRVANQGLTPAGTNLTTRLFFSRDAVIGEDVLLGQYSIKATLPPGTAIDQTVTVRLPQASGDYWVVAQTDINNDIAETLENNNAAISARPVHVQAAYAATVETALTTALAGTPVAMAGQSTGAPAGSLVNIHIHVNGTHRIISAFTEPDGSFATTWKPLPGEAGVYQIGAAHPGEADAPVQDTFTLLGFRVDPGSVSRAMVEGGTIEGAVSLVNLSDVPLNGLQATILEQPSNLQVTLTPPGSLPGAAAAPLTYRLTALDPSVRNGLVRALVRSSEGATNVVSFFITVEALRPQLAASPSPLLAGMVRGGQTLVEFAVANTGGATSGPVAIVLPPIPWLRVVSTNTLPPLEPGQTNHVTLQLTPPDTLGLGEYRGTIVLDAGNSAYTLPFNFRAVSDLQGDLLVKVVDEFTYYAEGSPAVSNATVIVRDAVTRAVVTNGLTDVSGTFYAAGLTEAYYDLEISADRHNSARETVLVLSARTNNVSTFIPRQMVQYRWTVEPTTVEDRTRITIETQFETVVPAPVVTIEPALIDLSQYTAAETQIELKISNHGLIAAGNFRLNFGTHPDWELAPLISEVGTLPPRSSLSVPMMIRRKASGGGFRPAGGSPCTISGNGCWELLCGLVRLYCAPIQVINAGGNCGSSGPSGPGWPSNPTGPGGNSPGGRGGPIYTGPTYSLPDVCDCSTLPKVCLGASLSWKPDSVAKKLADMVLSKMPSFSVKKTDVSLKLSGEICSCCKDKQLSYEGNVTGSAKISVTVAAGPNFAVGIPLTSPPGWSDVHVNSFDALLGVEATLSGSVEVKLDRKCKGETKLCLSGGVSLQVFAGAQVKASVEGKWVETGSVKYSGEIDGQIGMEGTLSAKASGCTDTGVTFELCGQLKAKLHLTGSLKAEIKDGSGNIEIKIKDIGLNGDQTVASAGSCGGGGGTGGGTGGGSPEEGEPVIVTTTGQEFLVPDNEVITALVGDRPANSGVCAKVRLQLDQEAVLARDAFRARLEIDNDSGAILENLGVEIEIKNAAGQVVSNLFVLRAPELNGLGAVDGTGTLPSPANANATWILLPTVDAAPDGPLSYFVGGTLRFTQEGSVVRLPLLGAPITVHPLPQLKVDYFHQRDVYADDPFTEDVTEPSLPFSLAVLVQNTGHGVARQFRVASAQPKIVENEKGLLIDFKILASEVAGQNLTPSLTVQFGDIAPGETGLARWLFSSTLQGLFTDYSAKFENLDIGGNSRLAIITNVAIHEMIQMVWATGEFDDGRPDFLVNEIPDPPLDLPDTVWFSDGTRASVTAVTNGTVTGALAPGSLTVTLAADLPLGWAYLRVPDPGQGQYRLVRAVRSDGRPILQRTNVWTTDRTFIGQGLRPLPEHLVHLLDFDSTGRYTLTYEPEPGVDAIAPSSRIAALPLASRPSIPLRWQGEDNAGGSGVAYYDVFVATDGGAYANWLARTPQTAGIYPGEVGHSYRFYTVATDGAGNTEAAPAVADAATSVSVTNRPPVLAPLPLQSVAEGETLRVAVRATDPDGDALIYSIAPGAPAGLSIDPASGQLTWTTGELQGPGDTEVLVVATDNGEPPLSASQAVRISVSEVNSAPTLEPLAAVTIVEGETLTIPVHGSDGDLPAQALTYTLLNAPGGLAVNAGTGLLQWVPGELDGGTTSRVSVVLRDNGTPSLAATQTFTLVVLESNQPPVLAAPPTQTVVEGWEMSVTMVAHDPDQPAQSLRYSLVSGPAGARLDPETGVFTWTPGEAQGPGTNDVAIRVSDLGDPPLSAETNFVIVVLESNTAPVLVRVPTQVAYVRSALRVTNVVIDPDIPTNVMTFRFGGVTPRGFRIGTNSGLVTWIPGMDQAPGSNWIQVIVTDNGTPPLSATNEFAVLVGDFTEVALGSAVVSAGGSGRLPINVNSSSGVTNVSFIVAADPARITNWSLAGVPPDLGSLLTPLASDRALAWFDTADGAVLVGRRTVGLLEFQAPSNQVSRIVPVSVLGVTAMQGNGVPVPAPLGTNGRVVVVGAEPLLEPLLATNGVQTLRLYGRPGHTYTLESAPALIENGSWRVEWQGTMTDLSRSFDVPRPASGTIFYRARE